MLRFLLACALLSACVSSLVAQSEDEREAKPFFVTYHLAGVHLTDKNKWLKGNDFSGVYDLAHHYSLRDGDGPDGCEFRLTLKPGLAWKFERAELREIFGNVSLPLKTGRGVAIGDTMAQVKKKIGAPSLIDKGNYLYIHNGQSLYRARYGFKNGRLSEIEFYPARRDSKQYPRDGCL